METVTITPNLKRKRVFHAILGLLGLLVTAEIFYGYMVGNTPDDWYLYLPVVVWVMVGELGRALGYLELSYPEISLLENKLKVVSREESEIDLSRLSWIRQTSNRIEFEYRSTGIRSYFEIPWSLRKKLRLETLKIALQERCQLQMIEFESDL